MNVPLIAFEVGPFINPKVPSVSESFVLSTLDADGFVIDEVNDGLRMQQ